ncbi:DUF4843 domain-containing protein [Aquiflexum sp. TKW24L]|uniref:DUF4843 domain-containing protein n=1 Tax=Aquiflexum sp. TKW24L TaxID=2942212 RepID=UPI0020C07E20|nr:DUF4843 domain-containing protein [Aquiflexum sp. TKW24L]MCL6261140.1 DUF4843 domain-containing protein [Aquiflexum sp. TKW24L]
MKKILALLSFTLVLAFSSCIEQNYPTWSGAVVEFQDAVVRAPAAGVTYPRIIVANTVGTVNLQVNLVSAHKSSDETITYKIVPEGTTGVAGTDFVVSGSVVIPAGSSTANAVVTIPNTGRIGGAVDVLLELEGNAQIPASENHKRVQIRITRPNPAP